MMNEQKLIIKNMPDGVLICKKVIDKEQCHDGLSSLINVSNQKFQIHYFNKTFNALFAFKNDFDKTNNTIIDINNESNNGN